MITFSCPGCQATFRLPDEMAGKSARCSKCNHKFTVPGGVTAAAPAPVAKPPQPAPPPAPPPPAKKVALNPVPEVLEAEIIDDEPVARRRAEPMEAEVIDDAAFEERPRSRRSRRDEDDDYGRRDEGEDGRDRPRRRRRRRQAGSLGWVLATLGGISFVLAIFFGFMMGVAGSSRARIVPAGGGGGGGPGPGIVIDAPAGGGAFEEDNQLTRGDPLDKVMFRSRAKQYRREMQAGKTYVIDLQSNAFDAFLRLEGPNGEILAQNDDFQGLNSRIVFQPQRTDNYVIVATSLDGRIGPYRIIIREQ
jgi:predicted Zn finger-like uncharacterized protein